MIMDFADTAFFFLMTNDTMPNDFFLKMLARFRLYKHN
jgi:GT2 family glycosyltransferase